LGCHPHYNAQIIDELHFIQRLCESIRPESRRRTVALSGLRGSRGRARKAILDQRAGHDDRVVLAGRTDGDLDSLIDRLIAANAP
jgi:hypothetical protein